jgi:hypothetical protein
VTLLAEALSERADARRRLSDLRYRIGQNARVQEGTRPAEDPQVLLNRALDTSDRIRVLAVAIDVTNVASTLPDGTTVTEALAHIDALDRRIRVLTEAADRATDRVARRGRSEVRELSMFDVGGLRDDADRLAAERRVLDAALQLVNWTTELHVPV